MDRAAAIAAEIAALPRRDTPAVRAVRRRWSGLLKLATAAEVLETACAFERAAGQQAKWVAYELIRFHPGALAATGEEQVADFATRLASWFAVDAFGTILAGRLWARGQLSDGLVDAWSHSPDRWVRRLALVATVGLNAAGPGRIGDAGRTLAVCRRLAADRDDMVEKGLSWALRELSKRNRAVVEGFMAEMGEGLAPRVRREVRNKLATGLKSGLKGGRIRRAVTAT
ncbi:MAG: DNA alkylation repair protein [Phenylobacterium sp.]